MKKPEGTARSLTITNGKGRLFVQSLLPDGAEVKQVCGTELYRIGGRDYPPDHETGPAPECRVEVSPSSPRTVDYFLHVLTATDASVPVVPRAAATVGSDKVTVTLPGIDLTLAKDAVFHIQGPWQASRSRVIAQALPNRVFEGMGLPALWNVRP